MNKISNFLSTNKLKTICTLFIILLLINTLDNIVYLSNQDFNMPDSPEKSNPGEESKKGKGKEVFEDTKSEEMPKTKRMNEFELRMSKFMEAFVDDNISNIRDKIQQMDKEDSSSKNTDENKK